MFLCKHCGTMVFLNLDMLQFFSTPVINDENELIINNLCVRFKNDEKTPLEFLCLNCKITLTVEDLLAKCGNCYAQVPLEKILTRGGRMYCSDCLSKLSIEGTKVELRFCL